MDNQIALNDIKSIETCKALAFDAIQRIEIEQNNLRALQQRIVELSEATKELTKEATNTRERSPLESR